MTIKNSPADRSYLQRRPALARGLYSRAFSAALDKLVHQHGSVMFVI